MTDLLRAYKNTSQSAVAQSFLVSELFDVFEQKHAEHKNRINQMLGNYPSRHLDTMLSNIFSARKQSFKRVMFELMLHEQLFRLGFVIVVAPGLQEDQTPDFLVTTPDGESFYLEAATVEGDSGRSPADPQAMKSGNFVLEQCKTKMNEKRQRYRGILDKPLVVALNVMEGGLSQTQERDLFFGGDDFDKSEDGIFTKNGRTGVREGLAGVWYFDRLEFWRLPHARYCYIPNQYIKPQLIPAAFRPYNLLWMTDNGIEYFNGEPFLNVPDGATPRTVSKTQSEDASNAPVGGEGVITSSALEELVVVIAVIGLFFATIAYYLF